MILARRLEEYNEFFWKKTTGKKDGYNLQWVINDLPSAQKNEVSLLCGKNPRKKTFQIQDLILGKRMKIKSGLPFKF